MATTQSGPTKAELEQTLEEIDDLCDEALDPELSREDVIGKVKEISALASGEELEEDEEGEYGEVEEGGD